MKTSIIKTVLLASSIAGLAVAAAPDALARYHRDGRAGAISFSRESGGYCDSAGCPDHFWNYPVHYGPVFFQGRWFLGPVYFRGDRYGRQYWVRGGWHRDEWSGRRPGWARNSHDGPALGFRYYIDHGFRIGDRWRHQNDDNNGGRGDWNGGDHAGRGDWHRSDNGGQNPDNNGRGDWHRSDNGGQNPDNNGRGDWHRSDNGGQNPDNNGRGDWHRTDNGGQGGPRGNGNNAGGGQRDNVIHVTAATYGGTTCHQPNGNVTQFLAAACNGKKVCDYSVQYKVIGDPAPGCAKDFAVQWTCSVGNGGSASAAAEAGLGSHVTLQCANPAL